MLIDLSEIFSVKDKNCTVETNVEMDFMKVGVNSYKVRDGGKVLVNLKNHDNKLCIDANVDVSILMPCDRCLEDVEKHFDIVFSKEIDMNETGLQIDSDDDIPFIADKQFDTEQFVYNEVLVRLPMKVLCKDDCKGICVKCGQNLNIGSCKCDTAEIDPRMSKILDVFNQFKEV